MADYRLNGPDESQGVFYRPDRKSIPNTTSNRDWMEYIAWRDAGGVPDPQYTTEEQAQIDYEVRQNARIAQLRRDAVELFEFILAIFQVGRDNGAWTASDFDQAIRDKAAEWIQTIDDYRNDSPGG